MSFDSRLPARLRTRGEAAVEGEFLLVLSRRASRGESKDAAKKSNFHVLFRTVPPSSAADLGMC
jgi:hypothetical protein